MTGITMYDILKHPHVRQADADIDKAETELLNAAVQDWPKKDIIKTAREYRDAVNKRAKIITRMVEERTNEIS